MNCRLILFVVCVWLLILIGCSGGEAFGSQSEAGVLSIPVYIRLNQVGYLPTESKLTLVLSTEDLRSHTFSVVRDSDGSTFFTGNVGPDRGAYGNFAHLYELDFTGLSAPGTYHLRLGNNTSPTFTIGENAYAGVISSTLRFFRVQRCGDTDPLLHSVCHLKDGFASGGWHDAGDYLKFLITTGAATNLVLTAYQRRPEVFYDRDKNSVPDMLDEARIGLDWMLKLWDPTNLVLYYQVGDESDHDTWRLPEGDDANRPTRPVWACEPGKGANVAGKAAAALALASALWNDPAHTFHNPTLAATYRTAAEQIYAYGKERPQAQPATSGFYTETSWQDDMALAAAELYRATGNATYLSEARGYAAAAGHAWSFDWDNMHALAHYEIARLDPTYVDTAKEWLDTELASMQTATSNNLFRVALTSFYWGSASAMVGVALEAMWYEDLSGNSTYHTLAQVQRDYVLGGNPWGVCWVNSLGTVWPHYPHHQVADLTQSELIGFWDEGPMARADWEALNITLRQDVDIYAPFQSEEAVYHDDVADYATNEPTIIANALGLALIAWYAPTPASLEDAIIALKILVGLDSNQYHLADVNGDGKIGIAEVISILQKVAGIRDYTTIEKLTYAQFMSQLKDSVGSRDSNTFVRLTNPTVKAYFEALLLALLENDLTTAQSEIKALSNLGVRYKLVQLTDAGGDGPIFGFMERVIPGDPDYRGWGAALVRPSGAGYAIYQAPHIKADQYTENITLDAFMDDVNGRVAMFAGTDRRANGDTDGDGSPDSDVAHDTENLFHALTAYLANQGLANSNPYWFTQIHGASDRDSEPTIVGSNGADTPALAIDSPIVQIDNAVDGAAHMTMGVCGWAEGPNDDEDGTYSLCATTNIQGDFLEGLGLPQTFLHFEIEWHARNDYMSGSGPGTEGIHDLLEAIANVL